MSQRRYTALLDVQGRLDASLVGALRHATASITQLGETTSAQTARLRELTQAGSQFGRVADRVSGVGRAYRALGSTVQGVSRTMGQSVDSVTAALQRQRDRMQTSFGDIVQTASLAATVLAPARLFAGYESGMLKVQSLTRATDAELAAMSRTARELGATTVWSASQAAEAMAELAMAGFNANEITAAMPGLLSLATAGQIGLGEASGIAATALRSFGLEAGEMARVGDVLTNAFTSSATTLPGLGESLKVVAPVAASFGVAIEDTVAAIAQLGDAGIRGSEAGTGLRAVMSRLAAPSGEAAETMAALGVSVRDAQNNMRPLGDVLRDVERRMGSYGTAQRAEVMRSLFGLEALSSATVLMARAADGSLSTYTERLRESGTAARVAGVQASGLTGTFANLTSAAEELGLVMGEALAPTLTSLMQSITSITQRFGEFASAHPRLTTGIGQLTLALLALKVGMLAVSWTAGALAGGLIALKAAVAVLTSALVIGKIVVLSIAGAISAPVAAFVALGAAIAVVIWKWREISAAFAAGSDVVAGWAASIGTWIGGIADRVGAWVVDAAGYASRALQPVADFIARISDSVGALMGGIGDLGVAIPRALGLQPAEPPRERTIVPADAAIASAAAAAAPARGGNRTVNVTSPITVNVTGVAAERDDAGLARRIAEQIRRAQEAEAAATMAAM